jgi:hypothetical protein
MKRLGGWWRLWFAISGLWVVLAIGIGMTIIISTQSAADRMKFSVELACPAPIPKPWKDVIASQEFRQLAPDQQEAARQQYFREVVAPQLSNPEQIAEAKAQFDAQYGQQVPTIPPPPPGYVLERSSGSSQAQGTTARSIDLPGSTSYKVNAPDGSIYEVSAPRGATQEQVIGYAKAHYREARKPTLDQIGEALKRADAAGNTEDARELAKAYRETRDAAPTRGFLLDAASTNPEHEPPAAGPWTKYAKAAGNPFDQFDAPHRMTFTEPKDLERCNDAKQRDYASEVSKSRTFTAIGTVFGAASLPFILLILGLLTGWVARGFRGNNAKKQAKP